MNRILPLALAACFTLLFSGTSSGSVIIDSGATMIATIGLTDYNFVCTGPLGPCPTFPVALMPVVSTDLTSTPPDQFALEVDLKSTNDGQQFFIASLPFSQTNLIGLFRYNGGGAGFAFPNDPTFWGPDPSTDTFELLFTNLGAPFVLADDPSLGFTAPANAVGANLDSNSFRVAETTISLDISEAPEPSGFSFAVIGSVVLLAMAGFRIRRARL